jgi:hypothetical protein
MAGPPTAWTAAHVLRGLRLAMSSQPTLFRFVLDVAREELGEASPEYVALVRRSAPRPGATTREMLRIERHALRRSRSGATRVAAALNRDGVPVPAGLQAKGDSV